MHYQAQACFLLSWQFGQLKSKGVTVKKGPGGRDDDGYGRGRYTDHPNDDGGRHHTWYDPDHDNHISWDSDPDGDYRPGTGHEDENGRKRDDWDQGR